MDGTNRYPQGQTSKAVQIFQMYGPSRLGHRPLILIADMYDMCDCLHRGLAAGLTVCDETRQLECPLDDGLVQQFELSALGLMIRGTVSGASFGHTVLFCWGCSQPSDETWPLPWILWSCGV
jgi:hypothetical protein